MTSQSTELMEKDVQLAGVVKELSAELADAKEHLRIKNTECKHQEEMIREMKKQIHHLSSIMMTTQEIERRRIAMEFHDELGQALTAIKLHIQFIERAVEGNQDAVRKECENLLGYMDRVIEDVRRISLALSPIILEDLGLTSTLRLLISSLIKFQNAEIIFDIEDIDDLFSRRDWIIIYRIIQEALTNIERHAQAHNVSVSIQRSDGKVVFSIEDDGKGFDVKQASIIDTLGSGLGLASMAERVKMAGGAFDLQSMEGRGTRVSFLIPIKNGAS